MFAKALIASFAAFGLAFAGAPPAHANQTSLACTLHFSINVSPGLQLVDEFVQTASLHESLLVVCEGEVDGTVVDPFAGGDVLSMSATSDDAINCATIPILADGGLRLRLFDLDGDPLTVNASFGIVAVIPVALFFGELDGEATFEPVEGDCVLSPITRLLVQFDAAVIEV